MQYRCTPPNPIGTNDLPARKGSVFFKTQFGVGMDVTAQSRERAHGINIRNMGHGQPQ
jgi:hypothetical protein